MSTQIALSEDIIIGHILTRLPVKSLKRFTRVCKSWLSIISDPDPDFITAHIANTSRNPDYECLIINTRGSYRRSIDILSRSRFSYTRVDVIPRYSKIVGSINGLVCFIYNHVFLLWNPVTGLGKTIVPPEHYWQNEMFREVLHGFGYDYVENEFKVVIIYKDQKSCQGFVYASNLDSWNGLVLPENFHYYTCICGISSIIVEGSSYWDAYKGIEWSILKFEGGSNQFKEITYPFGRECQQILANVKDRLTLMVYPRVPETQVDVFLFNEECGVWSKTHSFGPIQTFPGRVSHFFKYGGEIVFGNGKMLYDPKTKRIKILGDGHLAIIGGCSYTPSFVFLSGMEQLNTQSHWKSAEAEVVVLTPKQSHMRLLFSKLLVRING